MIEAKPTLVEVSGLNLSEIDSIPARLKRKKEACVFKYNNLIFNKIHIYIFLASVLKKRGCLFGF